MASVLTLNRMMALTVLHASPVTCGSTASVSVSRKAKLNERISTSFARTVNDAKRKRSCPNFHR